MNKLRKLSLVAFAASLLLAGGVATDARAHNAMAGSLGASLAEPGLMLAGLLGSAMVFSILAVIVQVNEQIAKNCKVSRSKVWMAEGLVLSVMLFPYAVNYYQTQ